MCSTKFGAAFTPFGLGSRKAGLGLAKSWPDSTRFGLDSTKLGPGAATMLHLGWNRPSAGGSWPGFGSGRPKLGEAWQKVLARFGHTLGELDEVWVVFR